MRRIDIGEFPSIDDPRVKELGLRVQKMRSVILKTVTSLAAQNAQADRVAPMIVVAGVFHRIAECTLSVELLATKGFVRDAATLLLTLMELRLDLQYIALLPGREDGWLEHCVENKKPWTVRQQINEIFPDVREREAEIANYRSLSMVKHGNPAGGIASFSVAARPNTLIFSNSGKEQHLLAVYLFAAGGNLYQAAIAGAQMVHAVGFNMKSELEQLSLINSELNRLNSNHVFKMIQEHLAAVELDATRNA
jgi:hypothetical protein